MIIYKAENVITGKVYIGKTTKSIGIKKMSESAKNRPKKTTSQGVLF